MNDTLKTIDALPDGRAVFYAPKSRDEPYANMTTDDLKKLAASVPRWTRVEDGLPEVGRRCWITVNGEVRLGGLLMMTQILPPCEKLPPVPKWRYCTIAGQDMGGVFSEVTAWQYFNEPKPFGGEK